VPANTTTTLKITRDQLSKFLPDHETIRQFEQVFDVVSQVDSGAYETEILDGSQYFETVNKNLRDYPKSLTYAGGKLTVVTYTTDSGTITKTLSYTGDQLTTVTLSGDTPSGINLVKTLGYSGTNLQTVTYS
jgi:hypothetical protein